MNLLRQRVDFNRGIEIRHITVSFVLVSIIIILYFIDRFGSTRGDRASGHIERTLYLESQEKDKV
jgi:hypothetical protein